MKIIKLVCPECGEEIFYKNYWIWTLKAPFHMFGRRKTKCPSCGKWSWMRRGDFII